jgi:hemerythrin superfamily protein
MAHVDEQLIADHLSLDKLLQQLQLALANNELDDSRTKLDLFWARLAVHIRAEHLHLFPMVLNSLRSERPAPPSVPTPEEAQAVIVTLQNDHDFFMSELARGVKIIRGLPAAAVSSRIEALPEIAHKVNLVAERLLAHNDMEENQIYRWASIVLTVEEQAELAQRISAELKNRPPRFITQAWSNVAE